ncbi:MAG: cation diffusion facilitator family transporter [Marmoricola sp.]
MALEHASDARQEQEQDQRQGGTGRDQQRQDHGGGESLVTIIVALTANALIAAAKTFAAVLTGSASMVAEAAHSWADTGNEIFLLLAHRRGSRPPDAAHPRGHGRETYVWSLFAAVGLFTAGAVVSVLHGVQQLGSGGEESPSYLVDWIVLGIAFVLEGTSFTQAARQAHGMGERFGLHPIQLVLRTSDSTLRAVFLEDFAALGGILLAGIGIGLHELTGNALWDALGSVAVGLLLGFVALILIARNHAFLVGETVPQQLWRDTLERLLSHDEIERVTYLHIEYVGPMQFFIVAAVDLLGDEPESSVAHRLRRLEADIEDHEPVTDAVLTLSAPEDEALSL